MQKKRVVVSTHGPLSVGPRYTVPWEDVWLRWKARPGRRVYTACPCLITLPELVADLKMNRELQIEHPEVDFSYDTTHCETMLRRLDVDPYATDLLDRAKEKVCGNVYTRAAEIDRAEAERMLEFLLRTVPGVTNVRFDWRRNRDLVILPTSFAWMV